MFRRKKVIHKPSRACAQQLTGNRMNGIGAHTGQTYIQTFIFIYIDGWLFACCLKRLVTEMAHDMKCRSQYGLQLLCETSSVLLTFSKAGGKLLPYSTQFEFLVPLVFRHVFFLHIM
jgi:hypothetical protein